MDNRIIAIENYWPPVVRGTAEFQQIAASENPEFNKLSECIRRMLEDTFIRDATEYGVSRWEKMLEIVPAVSDSLADRKIRVLTQLNIRLPYTWRVLKEMISSFIGKDNFTMNYFNDTSILKIRLAEASQTQHDTVLTLLNNVVPQNVVIDLGGLE